MAQYAEFIDGGDLNRLQTYTMFYTYFDDPKVSKVKDADQYSIYATKIKTMMSRDKRYLFVMMKKDTNPVGHILKLSDMYWDAIQTRSLQDDYNVPVSTYVVKRSSAYVAPIFVREKEDDKYTYDCPEYGLTVTLLFNKNQTRIYQDKGNVCAAIETYNTIFSF